MANNHAHGAFAALEMLEADGVTWYDMTKHVNGFNAPRSVDTVEDTTLRPEGDAKTFLQGLRSGTLDFTLIVPPSGEPVKKIKAILNKADRSGTHFRVFPFGKIVGNWAECFNVHFTNPGSMTAGTGVAVTAPVSCQSNGVPTNGDAIDGGNWNGTAIV